jgi:PAS domain-containing protein
MIKSVDFALRNWTNAGLAPECVKVLSLDGIIKFMNPQGLAMFEADSADDVLGKSLQELWPAAQRVAIDTAVRDAAAGKAPVVEGPCPTFKGRPRYWEMTLYLINHGAAAGTEIIGVTRDISAQRQEMLASHASP